MYQTETLGPDEYGDLADDGTMPSNVEALRKSVVGRRIVATSREEIKDKWGGSDWGLVITLDDGTQVQLKDTSNCCAFTEMEAFMLHPERVDHIILGVGTTGSYTRWHIYADLGDVLELTVGWSPGNPFYYGYGFDIDVIPA